MNKNKIRLPYWVMIIGGSIGMQIGYAILILGKTRAIKDYSKNYLSWLKGKGVIIEIFHVMLISIFYLIGWIREKRYRGKNHET